MDTQRGVVFNQGMAAFIKGRPCISPYIDPISNRIWVDGWLAAQKEGLQIHDD